MAISKRGMTAPMLTAADMLFQGKELEEIAKMCCSCLTDDRMTYDPEKVKKGVRQVKKWMKEPAFQEYYRKLVNYRVMTYYGKAVDKLGSQVDNPNDWLANKAANDILTRFSNIIMGEEANTVTVKIEGMPEIGEPDGAA